MGAAGGNGVKTAILGVLDQGLLATVRDVSSQLSPTPLTARSEGFPKSRQPPCFIDEKRARLKVNIRLVWR